MINNLPKRKPTRLKSYNYGQNGYYFITICTKDRKYLFGKIINGIMTLNEYGKIAKNEINDMPKHYKNIVVDNFVIMPNHIHIILIIVGAPLAAPDVNTPKSTNDITEKAGAASGAPTIGNIVRELKSGISKKCRFPIWQRNYHDHIIRDQEDYKKIYNYIENNPLQWELDCHNLSNTN